MLKGNNICEFAIHSLGSVGTTVLGSILFLVCCVLEFAENSSIFHTQKYNSVLVALSCEYVSRLNITATLIVFSNKSVYINWKIAGQDGAQVLRGAGQGRAGRVNPEIKKICG